MKTTKTCGDHLTDLIATRLFFIHMNKKKCPRRILKKNGAFAWRERLIFLKVRLTI
jgi:hypothetical protein